MKANEFDRRFDKGENVLEYLEQQKARRPARDQKRVNVDFPVWMIQRLANTQTGRSRHRARSV